jgi:hypothetical protein
MIKGGCHCGRNRFEVDGEIPVELTRCTCTFCRTHGNLYAYFKPVQFRLTQGDSDAAYRWQTKMVGQHFCSACGCFIYSDSPAFQPGGEWDGHSRRVGLNARLIDDFEAADHPVTVLDGLHLW